MLSGLLNDMDMHSRDKEEAQPPEDTYALASVDSGAPGSPPRMAGTPRLSEAARLVIRGPASGHHLPSFTLPDSAGRPVQLWQYLQRSNVVLSFHHGVDCAACGAMLRELAAHRDAFLQQETVVLAIGPDQLAENQQLAAQLGHPFPLLSDPAGRIIAQQGLQTPSLIIADRWGEIWAAWVGGADHRMPSAQDILQWLVFIEAQCPECTMIEWTDQAEA